MRSTKPAHLSEEYWIAKVEKDREMLYKAMKKLDKTPEMKACKKWAATVALSELCAGMKPRRSK